MTYCVELFLCIILGQAAGHAIFNTGYYSDDKIEILTCVTGGDEGQR